MLVATESVPDPVFAVPLWHAVQLLLSSGEPVFAPGEPLSLLNTFGVSSKNIAIVDKK